MRRFIREVGIWFVQTFGTRVTDQRTGKPIGRALIIPWRGKIHLIGLKKEVRVIFVPQERLTYWKQEIGFATHQPVDFPGKSSDRVGDNR